MIKVNYRNLITLITYLYMLYFKQENFLEFPVISICKNDNSYNYRLISLINKK